MTKTEKLGYSIIIVAMLISLLGFTVAFNIAQKLAQQRDYAVNQMEYWVSRLSQEQAKGRELEAQLAEAKGTIYDYETSILSLQDKLEALKSAPPIYKEVIKIEYVYAPSIRPFSSLEELKDIVAGYTLIDTSSIWKLGNPLEVDCEDYVFAMIDTFLRSGSFVTSQYLEDRKHSVVAVPIGNVMFYVEADPQGIKPYKSIWFGYYLDKPEDDEDDDPNL